MAEVACNSDSDVEITAQSRRHPPPKRRRILDPSAITAVPIYSNKVKRKPHFYKQVDSTEVNEENTSLWPPSLPKSKNKPISISLSDSEEEPEPDKPHNSQVRQDCLFLPPKKHSRYYDDNIKVISSEDKRKRRPAKPKPRERARKISLKFLWRMDVHKIPVLSTDPLSKAVAQLAVKLKVPPSKILLKRNDDELPVHSTITQLDLGIADIINCLVITDDTKDQSSCDVITVRLQGKEKGSAQEYSLSKDAPLGSILSQYTSGLSVAAKRKVKFLFDGLKVKHNQTPSQLDMEEGDVIDVWA